MNWGPISKNEFCELFPYAFLTLGAVTLLLLTLFHSFVERAGGVIFFFAAAIALATLVSLSLGGEEIYPFQGLLVHDRLGLGFAQATVVLLLFAIPALAARSGVSASGTYGLLSLLFMSATGGLFMAYANDLLVFFVGLELLSLPLYVLTSLGDRSNEGTEAAYKYFLLGAVSSAIFVYGLALLWGAVGASRIPEIYHVISSGHVESKSLVALGAAFMFVGVAFKVGLVPFHMWVPDVYQGAPSWVVAWMSGSVKAGVFAFALRFVSQAIPESYLPWSSLLTMLAIASMVWGSFAALHQENIKRMLAYSGIAHAGYATLALVSASEGQLREAGAALIYYVLSYGIASLATFLVISLEEREGKVSVVDFSGLAKRKPSVAFVFSAALLSLAGIPPLAGFVAKFNVFMLAVHGEHYGPVLVGIFTSLVSLAYYLKVIVAVYMREPGDVRPLRPRSLELAALSGSIVVALILGILPGTVLEFFLGNQLFLP